MIGFYLFFMGLFFCFLVSFSYAGGDGDAGNYRCGRNIKVGKVDYYYRCESGDYFVKKNNDGFFARLQGHARGTAGEISYGRNNMIIDMNGHKVDASCCKGYGVIIGSRANYDDVSNRNVLVRGGYFLGKTGVFVMGAPFEDQETEWQNIDENVQKKDYGHINYERCDSVNDNIALEDMVLKGGEGSVSANNSLIFDSKLVLQKVWVTGLNFRFQGNAYAVNWNMSLDQGSRVEPKKMTSMISVLDELPVISHGGGSAKLRQYFNPATALYLSCADNAIISSNIFTARTKNPRAYAIVLKHSKNVRITNNTFEGFDVPVLMDKYSSILDDRGNVIKPDVTINSPQSRLYKVDLDRVRGDTRRPWWQIWR